MTVPSGKVYLIGAGPGDPELLTVKAARLLASVDVLLHDDLVPQTILALAGPQASILNVGKRCGHKSITQAGIHQLMIDSARRGLAVARLKSGDPLVFGRANEEMDALRTAGLAFEVVPGITAAFAAAAALPCSLTDRRAASSILLSSGHHAATDSPSNELHQPTRAIYMPGRDLAALAAEWRAEGLPASLPCAVISRAAHPDQHVQHTTLAALADVEPGAAPVLVLAGEVLRTMLPSPRAKSAGLAVTPASPAALG